MTAAITIHFRRPEITSRCIDSLLSDGWAPVLVWDNSADNGESLCKLQAQYAHDERVWLVGNSSNLGFGKGMNCALAELGERGYIGPVLLINNDVFVYRGMYEALHEQLRDAEASILLAPRIMQNEQEQGWLYYQPWFALVTHRRLLGSFAYLSGCCLLVSRPDNQLPLFDEDFFMYGEDVELSLRWRREGGRLILLDRVYLQHLGSASSGQAGEAYERFLVGSHWLLAKKLGTNTASRIALYTLRLLPLLFRGCLRSLRYRSIVPLYALSELWRRR